MGRSRDSLRLGHGLQGQHLLRQRQVEFVDCVRIVHYLRDAAQPLYEAARHAKKELMKRVRGIRPLERALEERTDPEADAMRGYCPACARR